MQIPTAKKAMGTHGLTCSLWAKLPGANTSIAFNLVRLNFVSFKGGWERAGMAQSSLGVWKNSFANLLLAVHCKQQYLAWQQQNEDSSGTQSASPLLCRFPKPILGR